MAVEVLIYRERPSRGDGPPVDAPPQDAKPLREEAERAVARSFELVDDLVQLAESSHLDLFRLVELIKASLLGGPSKVARPDSHAMSRAEADALKRSGTDPDLVSGQPLASSATRARLDLEVAQAMSVAETAALLDRSQVRVRQRLSEHSLLGFRVGNTWKVLRFQFDEGSELPGWDSIMSVLPQDVHPLVVRHFLDTPIPELRVNERSLSPREWLRSGAPLDPVLNLAAGLHEVP